MSRGELGELLQSIRDNLSNLKSENKNIEFDVINQGYIVSVFIMNITPTHPNNRLKFIVNPYEGECKLFYSIEKEKYILYSSSEIDKSKNCSTIYGSQLYCMVNNLLDSLKPKQ